LYIQRSECSSICDTSILWVLLCANLFLFKNLFYDLHCFRFVKYFWRNQPSIQLGDKYILIKYYINLVDCDVLGHDVRYMDTNVSEKYTFSFFLVEVMLKKWAEKDQWFLESDNLYNNNSYSACCFTRLPAICLLSTVQFTTFYMYVDNWQTSCMVGVRLLLRRCLCPLVSFHTVSKALPLVLRNDLLLSKYWYYNWFCYWIIYVFVQSLTDVCFFRLD
jgi:hypothetical protein